MERNIFANYKNSILFAAKKDSWDSCQTSVENLVREIYPTIPKKDIQGTSLFYAVKEHDIDKLKDALDYTEDYLFHSTKEARMERNKFLTYKNGILFSAEQDWRDDCRNAITNLIRELYPTITDRAIQRLPLYKAAEKGNISMIQDELDIIERNLEHNLYNSQLEIDDGHDNVACRQKVYQGHKNEEMMPYESFLAVKNLILKDVVNNKQWTAGVRTAYLLRDLQPLLDKYHVHTGLTDYDGYDQLAQDLDELENKLYPLEYNPLLDICYKFRYGIMKEMVDLDSSTDAYKIDMEGERLQIEYRTANMMIEQIEGALRGERLDKSLGEA